MKVIGENCVRGVFGHAEVPWDASVIGIDAPDLKLPDDGWFVQDAKLDKVEKRGVIQCFGGTNHVYAFGQDPESSRYSLTLGVFMQAKGCADKFKTGKAVANIVAEYMRLRVSETPGIVRMKLDDGLLLGGILTGLSVAVSNAEINLFSITLSFMDLNAV